MKKYWLLSFIFLLFSGSILAETYNGTKPMDLDPATPYGTSAPSSIDNAIREPKIVYINEHNISVATGTYTVTGTNTIIVGSSSSGFLVIFPTASTVGTSNVSKPYTIKNIGVGTMTLSITLDGVGSPTVSQNNAREIFTDGTRWLETTRVASADSATTLGTYTASSFILATAGVGSATTLTNTTLSGSTTVNADIIANSTNISPTELGYLDTASSNIQTQITNHTSDSSDPHGATLTQTTINATNLTATNGTISTLNATNVSGFAISLGTQTNGLVSLGTQTSGLLSLGTQTNGLVSLATHTSSLLSLATQTSGLISLGTQTNGSLNVSVGTVTTLTGSTGTLTGSLRADKFYGDGSTLSGIVTGSAVTEWVVGATTGTGSQRWVGGPGITLSPTYDSNGKGTITVTAAGTSSAAGLTDTGNTIVQETATDILAIDHASIKDGTSSLSGVASPYIAQTNGTATGTQMTNASIISGTSSLSGIASPYIAQTNGTATGLTLNTVTATTGTVTDLRAANATITTSMTIATSTTGSALAVGGTITATTYVGDGSQLTGISTTGTNTFSSIRLIGTTTSIASGDYGQLQNLLTYIPPTIGTTLLLHFEGGSGTASFADDSIYGATATVSGTAVISGSTYMVGTGSGYFDGGGSTYITFPASNNYFFGTNTDFTWECRVNAQYSGGSHLVMGNNSSDSSSSVILDTGNLRLRDAAGNINITASPSWSNGVSYAFAVSRVSGTTRMFSDGVQIGTATSDTNAYGSSTIAWTVGRNNASNYWNGFIDELRLAKVGFYAGNYTPSALTNQHIVNGSNMYKLSYFPSLSTGTISDYLQITSGTNTSTAILLGGTTTVQGRLIVGTATVANSGTSTVYIATENNGIGITTFINATQANITTSDTFISFRSTSGEEGSIAGTAVAGVIAYNTTSITHRTWIEDRTGLQILDVLEMKGTPIGNWKGLKRHEYVQTLVDVLDAANMPVMEKIGTMTVQKRKEVYTPIDKLYDVKGTAPKEQLVTSGICKTRGSKAAWGVYADTNSDGVDFVMSFGTGFVKVVNTGENIEVGDYLMSSDFQGKAELQYLSTRSQRMNYTLAKASVPVIWESGEQWRRIPCLLVGD